MYCSNAGQDWGRQFPPEAQEAAREQTKLQRLVTVEVYSSLPPPTFGANTFLLSQDVAQQVLTFVQCKSITGMNAVIDAGFTL